MPEANLHVPFLSIPQGTPDFRVLTNPSMRHGVLVGAEGSAAGEAPPTHSGFGGVSGRGTFTASLQREVPDQSCKSASPGPPQPKAPPSAGASHTLALPAPLPQSPRLTDVFGNTHVSSRRPSGNIRDSPCVANALRVVEHFARNIPCAVLLERRPRN
jgi:hypothetical protein